MRASRKTRNYDSAYLVSKWLSKEILKSKINDVQHMKFSKKAEAQADWLGYLQTAVFGPSAEDQKNLVIQYWENAMNDTKGLDDRTMKAILILQATFRSWIMLNKLRKELQVVVSPHDKVLVAQTAIRRWKARRTAAENAREKASKEKEFTQFCNRMQEGFSVIMFGRKYGNAEERILRFDSSLTCLSYSAGSNLNVRNVKLSQIYAVVKGSSGYPYLVKPTHRSWCIHLCVLGNRYIDIEAKSTEDYHQLFKGFERLRLLYYTAAPFYVDKNGIPFRAGKSIITNALRKNGLDRRSCRSEADVLRYRNAINALKAEYELWRQQDEIEHKAFQEKMDCLRDGMMRSPSAAAGAGVGGVDVGGAAGAATSPYRTATTTTGEDEFSDDGLD